MKTKPSSTRRLPGLCLAMIAAASRVRPAEPYVVGNEAGGSILSRFADVQCELQMTVGRTPDTAMPPEWAASGAKLGLPLTVKFSSDATCDEYFPRTSSLESLLGEGEEQMGGAELEEGGRGTFLVRPLNEPSFVSSKGQETVRVRPGRCSCRSNAGSDRHSFRFFLDFPDGAVKNDVTLPAERIYFMTACWNEDDNVIGRAKQWKVDIVQALQRINAELEEMEHDQSLGNFLQGIPRYLTLTERRRKLANEIDLLEETFPPDDRLVTGPNNVIFLKEGVIAVKRVRGGREEFHWVGTFGLKNFEENGSIHP